MTQVIVTLICGPAKSGDTVTVDVTAGFKINVLTGKPRLAYEALGNDVFVGERPIRIEFDKRDNQGKLDVGSKFSLYYGQSKQAFFEGPVKRRLVNIYVD